MVCGLLADNECYESSWKDEPKRSQRLHVGGQAVITMLAQTSRMNFFIGTTTAGVASLAGLGQLDQHLSSQVEIVFSSATVRIR